MSDALGVYRSSAFVSFLGSNVGLANVDPELRLGGMDYLAQRQVGGIDASRPIEISQEHFNLANGSLSHASLTHGGGGSFLPRLPPPSPVGLEYGLWKQALRRDS